MPSFADLHLIAGVILPALIAGLVLLIGGRGTRWAGKPRPFLGALAIGAGYLVAHVAVLGPMPVPSADHQLGGKEWLGWLVVAAICLSPLRSVRGAERWTNLAYVGLFSVAIVRYTLGTALLDTTGLALRLALTLLLYAAWKATERLSQHVEGPAVPASMVVIGTGISVAALLSGSAAVAQLVGAVCAGLGAAVVLGWMDPDFRLPVGAVSIGMIVFAGALDNAALNGLPTASWILLALAPAMPWVGELRPFESFRPRKKAIVDAALTAVPVAVAACLAYAASNSGTDY